MQKLIDILKERANLPEPDRWNLCREYLQIIVLKSIFGSAMGRCLIFQGGTCLRLCHNLKRYSEDLDFSLAAQDRRYAFEKLHKTVLSGLARQGYAVSGNCSQDKIVQKAFVRVAGLTEAFGFSLPKDQKLAIKIEVDVRPPQAGAMETYFVSKLGELFPILQYDLPTLFAGKALAILFRPYDRGRDYYDLIWFLSRRITGNMAYLTSGWSQATRKPLPTGTNWKDVLLMVKEKVKKVEPPALLKDLRPFLEDPADAAWIAKYPDVFEQLLREQPDLR
jgi:predicted nucleotidyltransferase component of viral defense system